MSLQAFFAQNVETEITEDFIVSSRFKDEDGKPIAWKIKTLTEEQNEAIRKSATEMKKGKNGARQPELKPELYIAKLATACIVYPDLKDAELQSSYGVMGADQLLKTMLHSGEYASLIDKIQELNGFDKEINEMVDEVKN